jgi:hypothetical protein
MIPPENEATAWSIVVLLNHDSRWLLRPQCGHHFEGKGDCTITLRFEIVEWPASSDGEAIACREYAPGVSGALNVTV